MTNLYQMNENENRKKYIDGLKGLACVLIMLAHYYGIYKYADNEDVLSLWIFEILDRKPWNFLVNESFWLSLFFVISGYLISNSKIDNIKGLVKKCIKRALRFLLPIYGACIFIFIIYKLVGFHNLELKKFVNNTWWESFYRETITVRDLLLEPWKVVFVVGGNLKFNVPWWCISGMFYSAIMIYVFNFLREKCKKMLVTFILLGVLLLLWNGRENQFQGIFVATLIGMAVCWYEKEIRQLIPSKMVYVIACVIVVVLSVFQIRTDLKPLYFAVVLGSIPQINSVRKMLSCQTVSFLGSISFGIYSFHWPIFCSMGAIMLRMGLGRINIGIVFLATYAICIAVCIGIAYIYRVTAENYVMKLLNKIEKR